MAKNDKVNEKNKKHYFKDFKAELKKVIWPTPKQLLNNTVAVLTIVAITAVLVFILDVVFDLFNKYIITGLQSKVETTYSENNETTSNETSDNEITVDEDSDNDENSDEENDVDTSDESSEVDENTTNETENNVE